MRRTFIAIAAILALLVPIAASAISPILANNTFSGGSFTSWTDTGPTYIGSCATSTAFAGVNAADEDGDTGFAQGASGATAVCVATHSPAGGVTLGLSQSFSIASTPTAQTYSFWYDWVAVTYGSYCQTYGTATNLVFKLNGTTITTISSPAQNAWTHVSGSTTALISGSNSIEVDVTLTSATGFGNSSCTLGHGFAAQPFSVDDVVLSATVGGNTYQPLSIWKGYQ
ncbi:MAG: hypothetical protein ACYC8W_10895 [Candidatus Tyrphobacter sp.]